MNNINKTLYIPLYIPLYGKNYVSKKNIILKDLKAEKIWESIQFELKGKSKSKWLAYYMAMRSKVFDEVVSSKLNSNCIIFHLGCGLDSRCLRVKHDCLWVDIDFESVINERRKFYRENELYKMVASDIRDLWYLNYSSNVHAIIIMEGVSMYLKIDAIQQLFNELCNYFNNVSIIMDYYSELAAKLSKIKNPINDVGVYDVFGFDDPKIFESECLKHICDYEITPSWLIDELKGIENKIFRKLYASKFASSLYKMVEYHK